MDQLQYKVLEFDLPADDFDPDFTPENGIQYLQQVAYERQRCPAVVVRPLSGASVAIPTPPWSSLKPDDAASKTSDPDDDDDDDDEGDAAAMPDNAAADDEDLPDIHRPTAEWRSIQQAEFGQLRDKIAQLRPQFARRQAATGANGAPSPVALPAMSDSAGWRQFMLDNRPLLTTMLRLDQPSLELLLDHQLDWLRSDHLGWDAERLTAVGRWIYSLLGCLHAPLEPDVHSTLRALARRAVHMRNSLSASDDAALAVPLNLLVCIVAANFGQADLAEHV